MVSHNAIDQRSLYLAEAIVARIDADPERGGLAKAREVCRRWHERQSGPAVQEWLTILEQPWDRIRTILLDNSEEGRRLRQSSPFCGVLSPRERWQTYRSFRDHETRGS